MAKKNETPKQAQGAQGRAQTYTIGQVAVDAGVVPAEGHAPAQETNPIGTLMSDGTVFGGVSPTTNAPMYVAQLEIDDSDIRRDFRDVQNFARDLEIAGNQDFRVPDEAEMKVLYENRNEGALSKIFNQTSSFRWEKDQCFYWTSKSCGFVGATAFDFSAGKVTKDSRGNRYSTVCIR